MKEIIGNIWTINCDAICITTNGVVKDNGELVMGAGIALQCKNLYPQVAKHLGTLVKMKGNIPIKFFQRYIKEFDRTSIIVSFPTKNHFKNKSDINLIINSANLLVTMTNEMLWEKVVLPKPGCSNGGLNWEKEVKPVIKNILDDRFYIIDRS